jgi:GT2 family glycosyltransferase
MMYDTTIGVLTYKRLDMLEACLKSIFSNTNAEDLRKCSVVVTNTSTDEKYIGEVEGLISESFANVLLVSFRENLGCARAWNYMAQLHETQKIAIFNDDVKVFPGWKTAVDETLADPRMGLMSLSLANGVDEWTHQEERNPRLDQIWPYKLVRYVCTYPTGALLMCRRDVFDLVGGFDENFFQALEDVDLGVRLAKMGYVNANVGTSGEVYKFAAHYGSASGGSNPLPGDISPALEQIRLQNHTYFEKKHGFPFPFPAGVEQRLTEHMR